MKRKIVVIASAVVVVAIVLVLVLGKSLYRSGDTVGEELPLTEEPQPEVTDTTEEDVPVEDSVEVEPTPEAEEDNITYISLTASYDKDDEASLQRGMCTEVNNADEEKDFLAYFFDESSDPKVIESAGSTAYIGTVGDENVFVLLIHDGESGYPEYAYGFRYSTNDAMEAPENGPINYIAPVQTYQDQNVITDDEGNIIKVEYSCDAHEYGTFNSTGTVYYDDNGNAVYREYYSTNGTRVSYYLYNDDNELIQYMDFGGMPYSGLESNPDIAIGVNFETYIFEK